MKRVATGLDRFERSLKATSYALLAAGLAALIVSTALSLPGGVFCLAVLVLSWRLELGWPQRHPHLVFALLMGVFVLDWLLLSGLVEASLHLLLGICVVKLFGSKLDKDYGLLYAVSFLFLLISSVYTLSVGFLAALLAYVFLGILAFILFESRRAFRDNPEAPFELRGYLRVSMLMTVLVAVVAAPIFVAIPRTNWGLFRVSDPSDGNLSGFSDRVVLGDIGRIISNRELFMRVSLDRAPDQLPDDLKWRGVALDQYDGAAWTNTERGYQPLPIESHRSGIRLARESNARGVIRQRIVMEPGSDVVFALGKILRIVPMQRGLGGLVLRDRNESLRFYRTPSGPIQYTVDSELEPRGRRLARVSDEEVPALLRQRFLQLPPLDERIARLARQVSGADPDPLSKALRLENHLRQSYGYSLDNTAADSPDPLVDFLFQTREGHCEFFATAMAVMLRTQGIASRVVNGFRLGEYNEWSGYWVVRQSDAHSWVEAYLPGAGWVDFDPTPAAAGAPGSWLGRRVGQMLDAIDLFWTEVVTFDRIKQLTFFIRTRQRVRDGLRELKEGLARLHPAAWAAALVPPSGWKWLAPLSAGLLAALGVLCLLLRRRLARWWSRWRAAGSDEPAPSYYLEFLELLRKKGLVRGPAETPFEFARRARTAFGSSVPVEMTELYYGHRFGSLPPPPERLRALRLESKRMRRAGA